MKKVFSFIAMLCLLALTILPANDVQAASYDKAYAAKELTVRAAAGTSYKALGKIKSGATVKVYGGVAIGKDQGDWYAAQQYGWSKIKYKGKTAWVKVNDLHFANPWSWAPGIKSKTLKKIKKDYVSKKDKTKLVKGSENYYTMYIKFDGKGEWYQLVVINCKTGWYHG